MIVDKRDESQTHETDHGSLPQNGTGCRPQNSLLDDETISNSRSQAYSLDNDDDVDVEGAAATTSNVIPPLTGIDDNDNNNQLPLDDKSIFQRAYDLIDKTSRRFRRRCHEESSSVDNGGMETAPTLLGTAAAARAQAKGVGAYSQGKKGNDRSSRSSVPGAQYVQSRAPGLSPAFYLRLLRRDTMRRQQQQQPATNLESTSNAANLPLNDSIDEEEQQQQHPVSLSNAVSTPPPPTASCELVPVDNCRRGWKRIFIPDPPPNRVQLDEMELKELRQECCITAGIAYAVLVVVVVGMILGFLFQ